MCIGKILLFLSLSIIISPIHPSSQQSPHIKQIKHKVAFYDFIAVNDDENKILYLSATYLVNALKNGKADLDHNEKNIDHLWHALSGSNNIEYYYVYAIDNELATINKTPFKSKFIAEKFKQNLITNYSRWHYDIKLFDIHSEKITTLFLDKNKQTMANMTEPCKYITLTGKYFSTVSAVIDTLHIIYLSTPFAYNEQDDPLDYAANKCFTEKVYAEIRKLHLKDSSQVVKKIIWYREGITSDQNTIVLLRKIKIKDYEKKLNHIMTISIGN